MKGLAGFCLAVGFGLLVSGGFDLLIHTARPDLAAQDPSMSAADRHLAHRARAARRLAPIAVVVGGLTLLCGLVLVLVVALG